MAATDSDCPLQDLPPEILGAIIQEAIVTEVDVCNSTNYRCRTIGQSCPAIRNPNIALLMTSKTLHTSFQKTPEHKVKLQFCSKDCAGYLIDNAVPAMFADVSSITFKETMTTTKYNEVEYDNKWDECRMEKWVEFIEVTRGAAIMDIQCEAYAVSASTHDLVWTIPISEHAEAGAISERYRPKPEWVLQ